MEDLKGVYFIHIGKCGGTTINKVLALKGLDKLTKRVHITPPPIHPSFRYIIVARGPISRVVSAFNWRYKLVIEDKTQAERFPGEYQVLDHYKNLNCLAESLYTTDGIPDIKAHHDAKRIHHIKEDINFYLGHLLKVVPLGQIRHVLMQESLDDDIAHVFGYENTTREKGDYRKTPIHLTDRAVANLRRFLTKDYICLTKLYCGNKISKSIMEKIL